MEDFLRRLDGDIKKDDFKILSDEEIETIITRFAIVRGKEGFSEDEVYQLLKWCESMRLGEAMVSLVVQGLADIDWRNGEATLKISTRGIEYAHELLAVDEEEGNGRLN